MSPFRLPTQKTLESRFKQNLLACPPMTKFDFHQQLHRPIVREGKRPLGHLGKTRFLRYNVIRKNLDRQFKNFPMRPADETTTLILTWLIETFPLAQQRKTGADDSLLESGIVDSLGTLDVIHFLESEFGVTVTDEEMTPEYFETARSIAKLVALKSNPIRPQAKSN